MKIFIKIALLINQYENFHKIFREFQNKGPSILSKWSQILENYKIRDPLFCQNKNRHVNVAF